MPRLRRVTNSVSDEPQNRGQGIWRYGISRPGVCLVTTSSSDFMTSIFLVNQVAAVVAGLAPPQLSFSFLKPNTAFFSFRQVSAILQAIFGSTSQTVLDGGPREVTLKLPSVAGLGVCQRNALNLVPLSQFLLLFWGLFWFPGSLSVLYPLRGCFWADVVAYPPLLGMSLFV